jgi:adenosine deaminase
MGAALDFSKLPKIELHCHLDACVRLETAADIARETGVAVAGSLSDALVAPDSCRDLADYLSRLDLALQLMQRPQDLTRIARELVEDMARDNVIYGEVRFAPQLHTRRGLTLPQVLMAVHAGLRDGAEAHGVETGLIVCALRQQPAGEARQVAELAAAHSAEVCALDLAGDEAGYPRAAPYVAAFDIAARAGLRRTAHAGENAGAASVREALELLGAERIGHGVRIEEDADLTERVKDRQVALDMCPRSNVQTRAVPSLDQHPIDRLLGRGLRVTVSTDGRTTSDTTVTAEFERLEAQFGWGEAQFLACQRNAALAAFASEPAKERLVSAVRPRS